MATLSQQVAQAGAGFGGGLATGISTVADAMRVVEGVARTAGAAVGAVAQQIREGFASNTELQRATVAFERYTGSARAAADIIAVLRHEAAVSPFNDQEVISAGRALISYAQGSTDRLLDLVRVSEQLAILDPFQGLTGGVVALNEALSGDFTSLVRRFEIPRTLIERLKNEGVPNLEIVKQALAFRGVDAGAIEAYGRSFEGLLATIQSFVQEIRALGTAGLFDAVGQAFAHLVNLIDRYGDQIRTAAAAIGEVFARMATAAAQALAPLLSLLDLLAPGLREAAAAEFAAPIEAAAQAARQAAPAVAALNQQMTLQEGRAGLAAAAGDMERLQALAARTSGPVAAINRELGQIGVQAAEIQLGADRIRRAYDDQLRPLERQLDLLQNSVDLQRVQNALASNRALGERLQLTREIQALERAGGGVTDPEAAGLTDRQRAIALALQERRLKLEELGLTEQQRPAVQSVQQQIAQLRRDQADALRPSQELLANYQDRVAVLQTESQRWKNLQADIEAATAAVQDLQRQQGVGPSDEAHAQAVETARERGRQVAQEWLDRYQAWIEANGGNAWAAIKTTFDAWYNAGGKQQMVAAGQAVGGALVEGITLAIKYGLPVIGELIKQAILPPERREAIERVGEGLDTAAIGRGGEAGFGPTGLPLPGVREPRLPGPAPAPTAPTVTVNVGDVQGGLSPERVQEIAEAHAAALAAALAAAAAGADPGPNALVPGNVR